MQLSPNKPLKIGVVEGSTDKGCKIKINGVNTKTRVHLLFTHFYNPGNITIFKQLSASDLVNGQFQASSNDVIFSTKRRIADEYRYCIDRQKHKKLYGNSLSKPSFLVNPLKRGDTITGIQHARAAEKMQYKMMNNSNKKSKRDKKQKEDYFADISYDSMYYHSHRRRCSIGDEEMGGLDDFFGGYEDDEKKMDTEVDMNGGLEFLQNASKLLLNLIPDEDGYIYIDKEDLNPNIHKYIHVMAMDDNQSKYKIHSLYKSIDDMNTEKEDDIKEENKENEGKSMIFRDNRQKGKDTKNDDIDTITLKQENRSIILLKNGEDHAIQDFKSSEIQTYDKLKDVYSLLTALSKDNKNAQSDLEKKLKSFSFITNWNKLSLNAKLQKLRNYLKMFFFCLGSEKHKKQNDFINCIHIDMINISVMS